MKLAMAMVMVLVGCGWGQEKSTPWPGQIAYTPQECADAGGYWDPSWIGNAGEKYPPRCIGLGSVVTKERVVCHTPNMASTLCVTEDEPMDIPAVEVFDGLSGVTWCADDITNPHRVRGVTATCYVGRWTCADKRRVLLTGEDGVKHCVLFQQQERRKEQ